MQEAELRILIGKQERKIGEFFALALAEYYDRINPARLERLLSQGRITEALEDIEDIALALNSASQTAFLAAGEASIEYIRRSGVFQIGFDQVNTRAVSHMQNNRLRFIQGFTEQQRAATRFEMVAAIRDGVGPREQARRFRSVVGLTEQQAKHLRTQRLRLENIGNSDLSAREQRAVFSQTLRDRRSDKKLQRHIRNNERLSPAEIDGMMERHRKRAISSRAVGIARTEALGAVHAGQDEAIGQAMESGAVTPETLEQSWNTAQDGRQRDGHQEIHQTIVPYGTPWINSIGPIFYPGDPRASAKNKINCRCVRTFKIL